jgi:anti-sigma28 factor (negative regulator of flagellin synthesis)
MERVAAVQGAIAAGTYSVPASKVAGKVMDAMLSGAQSSSD